LGDYKPDLAFPSINEEESPHIMEEIGNSISSHLFSYRNSKYRQTISYEPNPANNEIEGGGGGGGVDDKYLFDSGLLGAQSQKTVNLTSDADEKPKKARLHKNELLFSKVSRHNSSAIHPMNLLDEDNELCMKSVRSNPTSDNGINKSKRSARFEHLDPPTVTPIHSSANIIESISIKAGGKDELTLKSSG
jgi:hypothetical protein